MKKFNSGNLPYIAASGQALQFIHAGFILMGWWGALVGAILGVTVNLSIANAASRISDVAKNRRWLSYAGLGALFILSPAMVAPSAYLAFGILPIEWVRIGAAIVWALAPDASILLSGAIAGKSLLQVEKLPVTVTVKSKVLRKKERNHIDKNELVVFLRDNSGASNAAVARHFGVSRQAIANRRTTITPHELGLTKDQ